MQTLLSDDEIASLNVDFETLQPSDILAWALERSGLEKMAIASAFQTEGTVVIHMATRIRADVPILFLETGFQFAETLAFKQQLAERLSLNVIDLVGEYSNDRQEAEFGARLFESNPEMCCEINKVRPMFEALRGMDAWVTSVRTGLLADARGHADRRALRPRAGERDREGQPDGELDEAAGVALPERARPAAQPPVRPGLLLDRLCAVHPAALRRRA